MKSPLAAIKGASELLEEDMDVDSRQRFLSNIQNETERLRNFIDRLLQLAAVEKKQTLEKVETVDLKLLTEEQIKSKTALLLQKEITYQITTSGKNALLNGERFLLKQAISNLLDNAIDFAERNSEVTIIIGKTSDHLNLSVHNTGPATTKT